VKNIEEHKKIGKWLRERRELAGLSQSQLAELIGCHKSFVGRYEAGRKLDIVQFAKVASAMNLEPCEVIASCIEGGRG